MIHSFGSVGYDAIPTVTGQRVRLEAYSNQHFDAACQMWGDEQVVKHIGGVPKAPFAVWTSMQRSIGGWALLGYGYWAAVDSTTGEYLGEAGFLEGLRNMQPSIDGVPEAGWCVARSHWGQGIGTELVDLIHAWADEALGASETACIIDHGNDASVRLAERCGYQFSADASFGDNRTQLFRRHRATTGAG